MRGDEPDALLEADPPLEPERGVACCPPLEPLDPLDPLDLEPLDDEPCEGALCDDEELCDCDALCELPSL